LTTRSTISLGLTLAAVISAAPAFAQFGSIFRDEPPRPPGDVPNYQRDYRNYGPPSDDPRYAPPPIRRAPSAWRNPDLPPEQPLPAPMSLPPSSRPGAGGIQSEELPPPPGVPAAPPQPGQGAQPGQPTAITPIQPPTGAPSQASTPPTGSPAAPPTEEVVVAPPPQRIANPTAVFSGLDKISGRIISFDVSINETVQFGALQVTPRVCYSRPPTETPNTDSFVEVDELTLKGEIKRIFTGWMFAASPGLHAVEHPIYDVWLTDCKGATPPAVAEAAPQEAKPAAAKPLAPRQPARTPARPPLQPQTQPRAQQLAPGPAIR
jgi:hypothetical protein